jgi:ribosomal protein L35
VRIKRTAGGGAMNYKSLLQFGLKKREKENTAHILKQSLVSALCRFLWNLRVC